MYQSEDTTTDARPQNGSNLLSIGTRELLSVGTPSTHIISVNEALQDEPKAGVPKTTLMNISKLAPTHDRPPIAIHQYCGAGRELLYPTIL